MQAGAFGQRAGSAMIGAAAAAIRSTSKTLASVPATRTATAYHELSVRICVAAESATSAESQGSGDFTGSTKKIRPASPHPRSLRRETVLPT